MFKGIVLGAAALLSVVPAWAQDQQPQSQQPACLRRADIDTFNAPDDSTVIVRTLNGNKYKLALMGPCLDLRFRNALAIRSPGSFALSCISRGDSIINRDRVSNIHMSCAIRNITLYTPQEEAADKAAAAAKKAQAQ